MTCSITAVASPAYITAMMTCIDFTDICDLTWQSTSNQLIIAAHVCSDVAFLVHMVAAFFFTCKLSSIVCVTNITNPCIADARLYFFSIINYSYAHVTSCLYKLVRNHLL